MDEIDKGKLWKNYQNSPTDQVREQLIIEYSKLVKIVAGRMNMYLGGNIEYDDLVSYGIFGLIDAIDKFDLDKKVKFETYASLRIRGAILDQIRKMDWIPRTIRQKQKKIDMAIKQLENISGIVPKDGEIAKLLGITEDELLTWYAQLDITNVISLNEFVDQGMEPAMDSRRNTFFDQPEVAVEKEELKLALRKSLELLSEKEKKVILLYYYEDMTLKEISEILEVTESRISQLHTKSLRKLKNEMGDYVDLLFK